MRSPIAYERRYIHKLISKTAAVHRNKANTRNGGSNIARTAPPDMYG